MKNANTTSSLCSSQKKKGSCSPTSQTSQLIASDVLPFTTNQPQISQQRFAELLETHWGRPPVEDFNPQLDSLGKTKLESHERCLYSNVLRSITNTRELFSPHECPQLTFRNGVLIRYTGDTDSLVSACLSACFQIDVEHSVAPLPPFASRLYRNRAKEWKDTLLQNSSVPVVHIFGITMNGTSVLMNIHGFFPYLYFECPVQLVNALSGLKEKLDVSGRDILKSRLQLE